MSKVSHYTFVYQNERGIVTVMPAGNKVIAWAGMRFDYSSASRGLKSIVDDAIKLNINPVQARVW